MRPGLKRFAAAVLALPVVAVVAFVGRRLPTWLERRATMAEAAELVTVNVTPPADFRFGRMHPGVLQHVDRPYTYDVVPAELLNGFLFQGIHRLPLGARVGFTLRAPATVYFFFHHEVDGGYGRLFESLPDWQRMETYPQYDTAAPDGHGLKMVMYRLEADPGVFSVPPTTKENACFNIVFQPRRGR